MPNCTRITNEETNEKCGKDCELFGGWCDDCKNKHYTLAQPVKHSVDEAIRKAKEMGQRDTLFRKMPLDELKQEIFEEEVWMHDNPTHPEFSAVQSKRGHMKMIYEMRMEEVVKEPEMKSLF